MPIDYTPLDCAIKVNRRDSTELPFKFKHPAGHPEAGEPVDLTGNSYVLTVNTEQDGSGTELMALTNTNTPGTDGEVRFRPTTTETDQTPGSYFYDMQETDGSGNVRTLVRGSFEIIGDISA